jgi:DNA polymerase III subunit epsilon
MLFAIVDIETTGGSTKTSKITEIAIFKHNGHEIIDSYETLLNPEMEIPEFIVRLTGISDRMVIDAPKFYEVAKEIVEFTKDCVFVAHNVGFDYSIVRKEFKSLGFDYRLPHLCTVRASRYVIPGHDSYSLGKLSRALGIKITGRHRAGGDAEATAHLFTLLYKTDPNGLKTFIQQEINPKILHPNLDTEQIEEIPSKTGVYKFYDDANQLIYIGKSKNIRARVEQHLRNSITIRAEKMRTEIARIEFELTGSELIALLYESELIKRHKPLYNRALRKTNYSYGIFTYEAENGYQHIYIQLLSKTNDLPLSTFSSRNEANEYLHTIAEKYQLCKKYMDLEKTTASCFGYQVKKCHGACVEAESANEYNLRVYEFEQSLTFDNEEFFIVEPGRSKGEKSIIWIEKGSYRGFGYVPFYALKESAKRWRAFVDLRPEDKDSRTILRYFLRKNPDLKRKIIKEKKN